MSHLLSDTTLIRRARLRQLKEREHAYYDLAFIRAMPAEKRSACLDLLDRSQAQVRQDIFALAALDFKTGGYFVEFGAANGRRPSNSWLLEREFGWTGILGEADPAFQAELRANRAAKIDPRCVWAVSGRKVPLSRIERAEELVLAEDAGPPDNGAEAIEVDTVSLNDLLAGHNAPATVDYLSIDTKGTEFDILQTVDFGRWEFRVITVEHNYEARRSDVQRLLSEKGYARVHADVSRFDDWYVRAA